MPNANPGYGRTLHHKKQARNGFIPLASTLRALGRRQNHVMAFRRKCFLNAGDLDNAPTGLTGTTTLYRARMHTGYGATHLAFVVGMGKDSHNSGADPRADIDVTIAGGATTTETIRYGANTVGTNDYPYEIAWFYPRIAVTANTTYEIAIKAIDYGRLIFVAGWEEASRVIDGAVDHYNDVVPAVGLEVIDDQREQILLGGTSLWKRNGSHLYTWPGAFDGVSPTFDSTTWTNLFDGSTAVSSSSAGIHLPDLTPWCRLTDSTTLDVVLAVHASTDTGTGALRLQDSSGTRCSVTGISTTAQWHTATTTISNVDTLGKVDLQAQITNAPTILTVNAVSLYCHL